MEVQHGGGYQIINMPDSPLGDMIHRQTAFQRRYSKTWDDRLKDYGSETFCLPYAACHHLDMAVQEASEAWDLVEGGWKHHKRNPRPTDRTELMLELVDVAHFVINAFIFMGGQADARFIAASVARSKEQIRVPAIDLDYCWDVGVRSWDGNSPRISAVYGHGDGAHGTEWDKRAATAINYLRQKLMGSAEAIRHGLQSLPRAKRQPETFPAASGFVIIETMPWVCAAVNQLPGATMAEFYSAFIHKNDINLARQVGGY